MGNLLQTDRANKIIDDQKIAINKLTDLINTIKDNYTVKTNPTITNPATSNPPTTSPSTTTTSPSTTTTTTTTSPSTTTTSPATTTTSPATTTTNPTTTQQTESFVNFKAVTLNSNPNTEIYNYSNIYNKNVALLDDPNRMTETAFNTYIHLQNNKMLELQNELKGLETQIQKNKIEPNDIKAFKSMNNSQILNVELYNDKNTNLATKLPNYLIYGNNGCLEYENNNESNESNEAPTWKFTSCDANNIKQQFVSNKVKDLNTYNKYIDDNNIENRLNDDSNILFGFNVINPINSTQKCLQLNNDGVSIMPCTLDFDQRFKPSYTTVHQ